MRNKVYFTHINRLWDCKLRGRLKLESIYHLKKYCSEIFCYPKKNSKQISEFFKAFKNMI